MAFIIAIDFDGTLFENNWPEIGKPKIEVINKTKEFIDNKAELIVWTCRENESLKNALEICKKYGLVFSAVNDNSPSQKIYSKKILEETGDTFSPRKVFADIYVDDRSNGSIKYYLTIKVKETCKNFENRWEKTKKYKK